MSKTIRQTGLVAAGCQPWNLNMVTGRGPSFAYCSTLAVYIYEYDEAYGEYHLTSINATHSKTITSISWNLVHTELFATSAADGRICVWDVNKRKCIKSHDKLTNIPKCICWLPSNKSQTLAYSWSRGPISVWDTISDRVSTVENTSSFGSDISIFRFHHTDASKLVVGHIDGSLSFFQSGIRNKHALKASEEPIQDNAVVALAWDPLSLDYLLVARKQSGTQLVDAKSCCLITTFTLPSKMVSTTTMSWIDSAPGMFLTGDRESGVLRLWSASQSTPLQSFSLKSTGFSCLHVLASLQNTGSSKMKKSSSQNPPPIRDRVHSSLTSSPLCTVPPARVVCTFSDGGIGLYNLQLGKWEFLREQGHIETIFDCKFKPDDPKSIATASFDGTVKVWSVDRLTTVNSTIGNEGVIYSIAWAPGDLNCIACGTRKRGVFVWDFGNSKIIRRFKEHGTCTVYCVAWNQRDSHRLASCSDDNTCVVRRLDGELQQKFHHPDSAFGCEWSLTNKDLLATGCNDGIARVWDMSKTTTGPAHMLRGHTAKVFHVRWNPLIQNILCSGSDDKTIRVWDVTTENCLSVLNGHTSNVRGLAWNHEVPYLLASGSWDSTLKLWDTRSGTCIDTVHDHGADVYGLATHPLNPFLLATSSRDSTLRMWSLSPFTEIFFLKILTEEPPHMIMETPEQAMKNKTSLHLTGNMSKQLLAQLSERKNNDWIKLRWFSELFCSSYRLENLWDLVCVIRGQRESSLSKSYKHGILHRKHLTKYKTSNAQEIEHSIVYKSGTGYRQNEKSLLRAAELHLKLGNMKRHCEILVQLNQWERAISLAPAVSTQYWAELSRKYAASLEEENNKDAVKYFVASGSVDDAVRFLTSQTELQDALLVAQSASEGNMPSSVCIDRDCNGNSPESGTVNIQEELVSRCCSELANRFYHNAHPFQAASIYLTNNDFDSAINCLVKANKLSVSLCLARNLKGDFYGTRVAARWMAQKCETTGDYDIAIKLLQLFDPEVSTNTRWSSLHALCARCDVIEENKRQEIYNLAGLLTPAEYTNQAVAEESRGDILQAMKCYLLSNQPQNGLELSLQLLTNKMNNASWTVDDILDESEACLCVRSSVLKQQSNKTLRVKLLTFSAYIGAHLALRREYTEIVKPLLQHAKSMCDLCHNNDSSFPILPSSIQDELHAWVNMSDDVIESDVITRMRRRAGEETRSCMRGVAVVDGSNLPSHSDVHVSTISGKQINGAPFFLEDGRSVLSLNEALMWAKVNQFSPTGSGARICPF
nr:LOW QUALITY PROTEIN: WD repeat-containing protein 17 [Ciona intestinalis]|eukprot:XP_026693266.1 LOW QUALITY PROTEIN: WD repeat-containing protein 17 [Ciona intestinalis]